MFLPLLVVYALTCGVLGGGPIEGKVLDIETKRPIAGAIVTVYWIGRHSSLVDSQSSCYHVEIATTDSKGRYRTSAWRGDFYGPFFSVDSSPGTIAYKPGYTWLPPDYARKDNKIIRKGYERHILYAEPFKGTPEERLTKLVAILGPTAGCGWQDGSGKNLHTPYSAMYEEARSIAVTQEDSEKVEILRRVFSSVLKDHNAPGG